VHPGQALLISDRDRAAFAVRELLDRLQFLERRIARETVPGVD
jgi:hypothetical protein